MPNSSIILHIDFDSFFASVAQQDNPTLRNRPVAITATHGRNAIIAASREAKAKGIKSPSQAHKAIEKCPDLLFAAADFRRYFEISKKFLKIASEYSPTVELFSIDEVFIDVTKTARLFGGVDILCKLIKARIAKEIGEYITVSIGVSYNKLLAKLASGLKKPNGICSITSENLYDIYAHAKLTDVCGIGWRIEQRLHMLGIYSLVQLRDIPLHRLIAAFGNVEGHFLKNVGLGIDTGEVISYLDAPGVKSVSRHYCLPQNTYDMRIVYQHVYELCEEVTLKLRRLKKAARAGGLFMSGDTHYGGHRTLTEYIRTGKELWTVCHDFLQQWQPTMVRKIAVWTGDLVDEVSIPQSLFTQENKVTTVQKVVDAINEKFGDHTIRNGFLLYAQKLTTVPNGFMADRYERTQLAETFND